ncbi:MAG TPA: energy transducer TonB [Mucilaginibacter sp.]|nr:energy transducer TonB [Mucilaginibacter sp.]
MKYLYFLSLCLITFSQDAVAQVHKRFLNKDGETVKDSTKAAFHILYKKEDQDSSYIWSAVKLTKRNMPVMKGYYLDEELTIPHGKFIYYQPVIKQEKIDEHHSSIDTVIVKKQVGFYSSGLKEGTWIDYYTTGIVAAIKNYENNLLNGLYEEYDDNGKIFTRGYYVKGLREGDWNVFWADSTIQSQTSFTGGEVDKFKEFDEKDLMHGAYPEYDFERYVYKYLKKAKLPPAHGFVFVAFTVTADGKLIKPEVKMGISPVLDQGIVEAIINSAKWQCATLNKKKIEQRITMRFNYDSAEAN